MPKIPIVNLNTLLDSVVTSNIAVQDAQHAVTNATIKATQAATSAGQAAASRLAVDAQVITHQDIATEVANSVQENELLKTIIEGLESAIELKADQVTLDRAEVLMMLQDVLTAKSHIDVAEADIDEMVEDFHTRYLGASLEAPNHSWKGMELATGMIYYDIAKNSLMIYINANVWVPIIEAINALMATNNLADLPDKAEARTNLDVMSTQEVADKIQEDILAVKGQPLGLAELDVNGHVPASQLPSYVDDVIEVATHADLPLEGETGKIYIVVADETSNEDTTTYRWTGTVYAVVSNTLNASDVKSLYESNLDTNAYTDAEKTSLDVATVLNTTATTLPTAINEVHGEVDAVVAGTTAITYDGAISGLTATTVKTAIDEVDADLEAHKLNDGSDHSFIDQDVTTTGTPKFNSVQLNGGTGTQGTVTWNADEETLDLVTDGAVLQLGQEFFINVRNSTAVTITKGTPVMFAGTLGNSGRMLVIPMDGTTTANAKKLLGVAATDILAGADGKVSSNGKIRGLNTTGAAVSETWVDGDILYISPLAVGQLTKAEPTHTQLKMPVAVVINAHTAGSCYIRVTALNENEVNAAVVEELALKADTAEIESVNLLRADKYLAAQNIANMIYTGEDLTKIQYNTATDVDYEVFTHGVDGLSNIAHYVNSVLAGNTVLTYTAGDLVSAVYTGV